MRRSPYGLLLAFSVLFLIAGCREDDLEQSTQSITEFPTKEKTSNYPTEGKSPFFDYYYAYDNHDRIKTIALGTPNNVNRWFVDSTEFYSDSLPVDTAVLEVISTLESYEQQVPFVDEMIRNVGYPVWSHSYNIESLPENVIFTPFVPLYESKLSAVLIAIIDSTDINFSAFVPGYPELIEQIYGDFLSTDMSGYWGIVETFQYLLFDEVPSISDSLITLNERQTNYPLINRSVGLGCYGVKEFPYQRFYCDCGGYALTLDDAFTFCPPECRRVDVQMVAIPYLSPDNCDDFWGSGGGGSGGSSGGGGSGGPISYVDQILNLCGEGSSSNDDIFNGSASPAQQASLRNMSMDFGAGANNNIATKLLLQIQLNNIEVRAPSFLGSLAKLGCRLSVIEGINDFLNNNPGLSDTELTDLLSRLNNLLLNYPDIQLTSNETLSLLENPEEIDHLEDYYQNREEIIQDLLNDNRFIPDAGREEAAYLVDIHLMLIERFDSYAQVGDNNDVNKIIEFLLPLFDSATGVTFEDAERLWIIIDFDNSGPISEVYSLLINNDCEVAKEIISILRNSTSEDLPFNQISSRIFLEFEASGFLGQGLPPDFVFINTRVESIFNNSNLSSHNAINGRMWYEMMRTNHDEFFSTQEETSNNYFIDWIKSIKVSIKEGWYEVLEPINQSITDYVENELGLTMPQTIDEWYAIAAILGPEFVSLGLDFVPIVGDIKGFAEAIELFLEDNYQAGGIAFAAALAGILPVGKIIKATKNVPDMIKGSKNAFKIFRILRAIARSSSNIWQKFRSLIDDGYKVLVENIPGLPSKAVVKNSDDEVVGELFVRQETVIDLEDPTPNFPNNQADIGTTNIKTNEGWVLKTADDIDNASPTTPTGSNQAYLGKINLAKNAQRIKFELPGPLKNKLDDIVQNGDNSSVGGNWPGKKTEELTDDFFENLYPNATVYDNVHYNASKNGLDNVVELEDGIMIVNESKQINSGAIRLNPPSNGDPGLPTQMSDNWLDHVVSKMTNSGDPNLVDLANKVSIAKLQGNLIRTVSAVDKQNAEFVITRLNSF